MQNIKNKEKILKISRKKKKVTLDHCSLSSSHLFLFLKEETLDFEYVWVQDKDIKVIGGHNSYSKISAEVD